jgi:tRNA (cmo5U34)-methyltransferase
VTSLGHVPTGDAWEFDASVADVFDDMLARSIPQYEIMRELTTSFALDVLEPTDRIVDLGASRGEALARLLDHRRCPRHVTAHAIECSPPMLAALADRFRLEVARERVIIEDRDLRTGLPYVSESVGVVLAVLTVQFLPIDYRQQLVAESYRVLRPGGALVLVEKLLGRTARLTESFDRNYLAMKSEHGYSDDEITRKRYALEGVLHRVTASWNEDTLAAAGFRHFDCVWRWCNFAAWIAYKGDA